MILGANENNKISLILKVVGFLIFIVGFIMGFVLGIDEYNDFSARIAFTYWIGTFLSGIMFIAIANIIDLLQLNVNLQHENKMLLKEHIEIIKEKEKIANI